MNASMAFTRRGLLLTGLLGGSLALAPVAPASAATFTDISRSPFQVEIEWMAQYGISTGWPDGTYRPLEPITREAMAAFLHRLAGAPAVTVRERMFVDVGSRTLFEKEIVWMKAQGLSWGWVDGTYRPYNQINRDAMAAFVRRLVEPALRAGGVRIDSRSVPHFRDITDSVKFSDDIRWMRAAGIADGWPDGTYRPLTPVNRDAMAAFFYRLEGLLQRIG